MGTAHPCLGVCACVRSPLLHLSSSHTMLERRPPPLKPHPPPAHLGPPNAHCTPAGSGSTHVFTHLEQLPAPCCSHFGSAPLFGLLHLCCAPLRAAFWWVRAGGVARVAAHCGQPFPEAPGGARGAAQGLCQRQDQPRPHARAGGGCWQHVLCALPQAMGTCVLAIAMHVQQQLFSVC